MLPRAFVVEKVSGPGASHRLSSSGRSLVIIQYKDLLEKRDLSAHIEEAFGPGGLGALLIANVQGYQKERQQLLPKLDQFATLPDAVKARLEDPASHYSVGWSHGKESLADGQPDTYKGSYYANPLLDDPLAAASPAQAEQLRRQYPGYFRPNVWPREELPELEPAFKALGRHFCQVGGLVMEQCDRYISSRRGMAPGQLSGILKRSVIPKARGLHYYAVPADQAAAQQGSAAAAVDPGCEHEQAWCGWHTDHGSLTGLTAAMYIDSSGREVPCPDPEAGLYIRDRHGAVVRAAIRPDCMAFQVGEALQVHSGGLLRATPHYVRAARGTAAAGVSRNTFAVFMQPNVDEPMDGPPGVDPRQVAVGQWQPGQTFGQFAESTFRKYYRQGP